MKTWTALAALLLAGCVAPAPGPADRRDAADGALAPPPVPDFDFSTVIDPDHEAHSVAALHAGGHGLERVGLASLAGFLPPDVAVSISQVDVWRQYAVVSGMGMGLGFAIVDISQPDAPKPVGWFRSAADGYTARFSDDGNYVFYGCQIGGAPVAFLRGTCRDPEAVAPGAFKEGGVIAVDVSDKTRPRFVDFLPNVGSHNLFAASIGGRDIVVTETTEIIELDRDAGKLKLLGTVPGRHDATLARHPITGGWLLVTGTNELTIYDVDDPEHPEVLFQNEPTDLLGAAAYSGWHEQTLVPGVVDGRVVLAVAGEGMAGNPTKRHFVTFLDVTDPAKPAVLSQWTPPFSPKLPWTSYRFSAHEMAATPGGQVAIGWYHAGVWVVDVSTKERQEKPVTLAAYQPTGDVKGLPYGGPQMAVPETPIVWGAGWDARGYLLVPDMHTGLHVMKPGWGLRPALDSGQ